MNNFQFFKSKRLSCIAILIMSLSSMLIVSTNAYAMHFNETNYTTTGTSYRPSTSFFASMFGYGTVDGFTSTLIEAATLETTLNMVQRSEQGDITMVTWLQVGVLSAYLGTGMLNLMVKKIINRMWPKYTDDYYGVVIKKSCKGCETTPLSASLGLASLFPHEMPPTWLRMISKSLAIANSFTSTAGTSAFQSWWSGYFAQIYGANEPYKKAAMVIFGRHVNFILWPFSQGFLQFKYEKWVDSAQQMAIVKNSNLRTMGDGAVYLVTTAVGDFVAMRMGLEPWTTADGGFISSLFQQVQNQAYRTFHANYRWSSARTLTSTGINVLDEGFAKRVSHYHTFLPSNYWVWQLQTVMASIPGVVRVFWPEMHKMNPALEFAIVLGLNFPRKIVTVMNDMKMDTVAPPYNFAQMAVMREYSPTTWGQTRAFLDSLLPVYNFIKQKSIRITRDDAEAILIALNQPSKNICCKAYTVDRKQFEELLNVTKALHKTFAHLPGDLHGIDPGYLRAVGKSKATRSAFVSTIVQYYPITINDEIENGQNNEPIQSENLNLLNQSVIFKPSVNMTELIIKKNDYHLVPRDEINIIKE